MHSSLRHTEEPLSLSELPAQPQHRHTHGLASSNNKAPAHTRRVWQQLLRLVSSKAAQYSCFCYWSVVSLSLSWCFYTTGHTLPSHKTNSLQVAVVCCPLQHVWDTLGWGEPAVLKCAVTHKIFENIQKKRTNLLAVLCFLFISLPLIIAWPLSFILWPFEGVWPLGW